MLGRSRATCASCRARQHSTGKLVYSGKVGREVSLDDACQSAQIAVLNCWLIRAGRPCVGSGKGAGIRGLRRLRSAAQGSDRASNCSGKVFGEVGKHAVSSGRGELPFGRRLIELIMEIE